MMVDKFNRFGDSRHPEYLKGTKWIQFKIFMKPKDHIFWKEGLDWYHSVLRILKPALENNHNVLAILYTYYGPVDYKSELESLYEKKISRIPEYEVFFIWLRINVEDENRGDIILDISEILSSNQRQAWDYEILKEYDILGDIGNRFGRRNDGAVDEETTIRFIKYLDAGCRYILSTLDKKGNWCENIDVWGIPHLINNALGGWLRVESRCEKCGEKLHVPTYPMKFAGPFNLDTFPAFPLVCPKCNDVIVKAINI